MKKILFAAVFITSCSACIRNAPIRHGVWLSVTPVNVESGAAREIAFDFKFTSDSAGTDLQTPMDKSYVNIAYGSSEYSFTVPSNEATVRLGAGIIVSNTSTPLPCKIVSAVNDSPTLIINFK